MLGMSDVYKRQVIDRNHLQISGDTEDVMGIDDIRDRWTAFGWEVKDMKEKVG